MGEIKGESTKNETRVYAGNKRIVVNNNMNVETKQMNNCEWKPWSHLLLTNFGNEVGMSLAGLREEYDEMIQKFEDENLKVEKFQRQENYMRQERSAALPVSMHPPSPTPSGGRTRINTFSSGLKRVTAKFSKTASSPTHKNHQKDIGLPLGSPSKYDTDQSAFQDRGRF